VTVTSRTTRVETVADVAVADVTVADLVVAALIAEGVTDVFALPGIQLFDAFYQRRSELSVYQVRHEQAASYMADGYSRASGRIGCFAVVPGPGVLNAGAGLATAWACCSKVLGLAGQLPSTSIGRGHGALHELRDQTAVLRQLTSWAGCARSVDDVGEVLRRAFAELAREGGGPVAVELPPDVLEQGVPAQWKPTERPVEEPDDDAVRAAAALLDRRSAPVIYAGGGILRGDACEALAELAEHLNCPVVVSPNAHGAMPHGHPLAVNYLGAVTMLDSADVVLAVGTRFTTPQGIPRRLRPGQRLIQVDADAERLARDGRAEVALCAGAGPALRALRERCEAKAPWHGPHTDGLASRISARLRRVQPQADLAMAIRAALPDDGIVVNGLTQVGYWARAGFPVHEPGTFITSGFQGALGFELPTALGAQVAMPDRAVVAIVGDGGFLFNAQELATAAKYELPVVTVLFNDGAFGNVRRIQREKYSSRFIASDLRNPDFAALTTAFGVRAYRAEGAKELERTLRAALAEGGPSVIEVPVGEMPDPWPVVAGTERV
jgi:acetolactate synthase-1/2/3 large subunit